METLSTLILYQNQLFGEGVESILLRNNFKVIKYKISENGILRTNQIENSKVVLIEFNWPLRSLENFVEFEEKIFDKGIRIILISNVVNKFLSKLIHRNKIHGIVLKSSNSEELIFAIKQVLDGEKFYSSMLTNSLFITDSEPEKIKISKREKQILSLLANMESTSEIAEKLSISKSTVKTHRRNLMCKFKAKNLINLLRLACRENLLSAEVDYCGYCYNHFIGAYN